MLRRHSSLAMAGSNHFVTTVTRIRGIWFVDERLCTSLLKLFEWCRARYRLDCLGYVLMPDHFHALLHQDEAGEAVSRCLMQFKKMSSEQIKFSDFHGVRLWRGGYDDVLIPSAGDAIYVKLLYTHNNPVKRGLVEIPTDYRSSSARHLAGLGEGYITIRRIG